MKYLVFSDIHGSNYYFSYAKSLIEKECPDNIILLGDLYYHGPRNALPKDYSPKDVCEALNVYSDRIIAVRGNCDAEVDEMISDFAFKESVSMVINNRNVMFTHGHKYNKDNLPENVDILIYGHFHTGFIINGDVICINAGSVSIPKNDTPHSYLLIDDNELFLKDLISGRVLDFIKF